MRLALQGDRSGSIRVAPLGGETFRRLVPEDARERLPDSLVLRDGQGTLRTRSAAVAEVLRRMGGPWRVVGSVFAAVPTGLADRVYDAVARVRGRLAPRPRAACPALPPHLRKRVDP